MTDKNKYLTLDRYEEIADDWCAIESFLDGNTKIAPAIFNDDGELYRASHHELQSALAKHFDIDLKALEAERQQRFDEVMGA